MAETVYEMMMKIGLHGGILTDLTLVGDRLTRIHRQVGEINSGFTRWHLALGGIGTLLAGASILGVMEKLVKHAAKFSDELVKLKNLGGDMSSAVDNGEMARRAFDISKRIHMSVPELLKIPGMAYSIFGKDEAVGPLWEPLAKYAFVMQQMKGAHGGSAMTDSLGSALRSGELMGRFTDPTTGEIDMPRVGKFIDIITRLQTLSHGMINEETILGIAQQGGVYTRGLSDEGLVHEAILAQAMGGPRAGTAYLSLWQQMAGGTMFKRTAQGMEEMGLLGKDDYKMDHGRVVLSAEAAKRLTGLIDKDPMMLAQLYRSHFAEMSKEQVAAGGSAISSDDQLRMVMRSMNRQTTQRMMAELIANHGQILRESGRAYSALGLDDAMSNYMNESVTANLESFNAAWENFQIALVGPQSSAVISFLQMLTGFVDSMSSSVRLMDPNDLANIGKGIAILGAGLIGAGGTALFLALGPAGWLVGGIIALGTAAVTYQKQIREYLGLSPYKDMATNAERNRLEGSGGGFWKQVEDDFTNYARWYEKNVNPWFESHRLGSRFNEWLDDNYLNPPLNWLHSHSIADAISGWFDDNIGNPIAERLKKFGHFFDLGRFMGQDYWTPGRRHADPFFAPTSFNPHNNKQILQPVTLTINLDGHQLAQAFGEVAQEAAIHPTGPPDANSWAFFRAMGNQDTA